MEVDVPGFLKNWKLVLINGLGQISVTLGIFCLLGVLTVIYGPCVITPLVRVTVHFVGANKHHHHHHHHHHHRQERCALVNVVHAR